MLNIGVNIYSFRTHKNKFGINSENAFIFIFQLQFSTVILTFRKDAFDLINLAKYIVLICLLKCNNYRRQYFVVQCTIRYKFMQLIFV